MIEIETESLGSFSSNKGGDRSRPRRERVSSGGNPMDVQEISRPGTRSAYVRRRWSKIAGRAITVPNGTSWFGSSPIRKGT